MGIPHPPKNAGNEEMIKIPWKNKKLSG